MFDVLKFLSAAAAVAIAAATVGCTSSQPAVTGSPAPTQAVVATATIPPTATVATATDEQAPTTRPTPTETIPTPTASDAPSDALTGTWATAQTTCAEQNAALEAAGFTADQLTLGGWDATCGDMMHGSQFTIRFEGGRLTIFVDGSDHDAWDGDYRIVDEDTFEAHDEASAEWYLTYEYAVDSDQLTIDMIRDDYPETSEAGLLGEQIAQTVVYETAPFSRQRYTSTSFAVPLTITLDPLLNPVPILDTTNLLTWDAAASDNDKVRFLLPVEVYHPGSSTPEPPPADYLAYLQSQADDGATFVDVSTLTVDGRPATILTGTTSTSLSGSLGCPIAGVDREEDCFGLQPEFGLRIAVIDMGGGTPLLAWARTDSVAPNEPFLAMFERLLGTVEFE